MNILINKYIYVYLLFMSCFTLMIHDAHMSIPETLFTQMLFEQAA